MSYVPRTYVQVTKTSVNQSPKVCTFFSSFQCPGKPANRPNKTSVKKKRMINGVIIIMQSLKALTCAVSDKKLEGTGGGGVGVGGGGCHAHKTIRTESVQVRELYGSCGLNVQSSLIRP